MKANGLVLILWLKGTCFYSRQKLRQGSPFRRHSGGPWLGPGHPENQGEWGKRPCLHWPGVWMFYRIVPRVSTKEPWWGDSPLSTSCLWLRSTEEFLMLSAQVADIHETNPPRFFPPSLASPGQDKNDDDYRLSSGGGKPRRAPSSGCPKEPSPEAGSGKSHKCDLDRQDEGRFGSLLVRQIPGIFPASWAPAQMRQGFLR
jgi:hypothetical protein